jgi:succinate dehydrogenase / fumarate reductase cytochrome b subunit
MAANERPLSPHLTVYKIELPMLLSGLSRISGVALSVGSILLVTWIASAVHSAEVFSAMSSFLGSFIGQFLLFGWTFSLIYHSINGIRHLIWDTGNMLEVEQIYASSKVVAVLTPIITITVWLLGGGFPGGGA